MGEDEINRPEWLAERLAQQTSRLNSGDLRGFGELLNILDELVRGRKGWENDTILDLAEEIKSLAEQILLSDGDSSQQGIRRIAEGVSLLRECLKNPHCQGSADGPIRGFIALSSGLKQDEGGSEPQKQEALYQDRELYQNFILEAKEHLESIETAILSLEEDPADNEAINAVFRPFHTIKGVAGFLELPDIHRLSHEVEGLLDLARNGKLRIDESVIDIILEAVDLLKGMLEDLKKRIENPNAEALQFEIDLFLERLRGLLAGQGRSQEASGLPDPSGRERARIGEILVSQKKISAKEVVEGLREQKVRRGDSTSLVTLDDSSIKVQTEKLDDLMDMVGELLVAQAMIEEKAASLFGREHRFRAHLSQLARITSELHRISMSMRMVPIGQSFRGLHRLVRDLSKRAVKKVRFEIQGEDTGIDRNMVDTLQDPLVHMLRNSIDHGIESPAERLALGKPEEGKIILKASHKGGRLHMEISDDGRGLDRDAIYQKALERGLIPSTETISDQELYALIFKPGFSTAGKVTEVSGRGVGMDVVRKHIEMLRGDIAISSKPGAGATFILKLPLTLAIIDGVIVRAAERRYIIPAGSVVESLRPAREETFTVLGRQETIRFRGSHIALVRLYELFGFEPRHRDPWEGIVVIAESDRVMKGILVDELVGKQQIVIKGLGAGLEGAKAIAGGAIMSDGTVGLILDIHGLFELSDRLPAAG